MKRQIINIDEELCDGCGLCIPNCHEGALQLIDGKARLISDLFCDGLGACIGHCPQGAITLEEREAEAYNESLVMEKIASQGKNTILAHLQHLKDHHENGFLNEALKYLREHKIELDENLENDDYPLPVMAGSACGCGSAAPVDFNTIKLDPHKSTDNDKVVEAPSELRQWPVQLHLLNPMASYFKDSHLLLASDCSAFTLGSFHSRFMKGKSIAIACPKLDQGKDSYIEKIAVMIRDSSISEVTVVMMEVPCCGGLAQLVHLAMQKAERTVPVNEVILSIRGELLKETRRYC